MGPVRWGGCGELSQSGWQGADAGTSSLFPVNTGAPTSRPPPSDFCESGVCGCVYSHSPVPAGALGTASLPAASTAGSSQLREGAPRGAESPQAPIPYSRQHPGPHQEHRALGASVADVHGAGLWHSSKTLQGPMP